ncbi:MAG TPA: hypothetical protein VEK14_01540 [Rhodomicrobium sp.]|nr:hypothetical protein [Rhodomicrobium sp.]
MTDKGTTMVHVVPTLGHGGTEVMCRDLVTEFNRRNVSNVVAALKRGSGSIEPELVSASGRAVTLLAMAGSFGF